MHAPTGNIIVLKSLFYDLYLQLYNLEPRCAYDTNLYIHRIQRMAASCKVLAAQPRPNYHVRHPRAALVYR